MTELLLWLGVVPDEQTIDLLHHPRWRLATENGTLPLVCLQLVNGEFFFPAFMVQFNQSLSRREPAWFRIQNRAKNEGRHPRLMTRTNSALDPQPASREMNR